MTGCMVAQGSYRRLLSKCALSGGLMILLIGLHLTYALAQGDWIGRVIEVDVAGLKSLMEMDPNVLVVDIRSPDRYSGPLKPIPRSINIPADELRSNPGLLPSNKTLVLVCPTGSKSLTLARALAENGRVVYVLKGGLAAWHKAEGAVPAKQRPGPYEHEHKEPKVEEDMGC